MTLKTKLKASENSALLLQEYITFTNISNRKQLFKIVITFHNITIFIVFLIK